MITLKGKLKKDKSLVNGTTSTENKKRPSIRDQLLIKEVQEMEQTLPPTCKIRFDNPHQLHEFKLIVTPDEGYWMGGRFVFNIFVTEDYNMAPPLVHCETKLWHPNISENGAVCLSLLRQSSLDGLGWAPTRRLKDVVWGLNSLFTNSLRESSEQESFHCVPHKLHPRVFYNLALAVTVFTNFDEIHKLLYNPYEQLLAQAYLTKMKSLKDLLNFDDPLNMEASELYALDKEAFRVKVRQYVSQYSKR